MNTITNTDSVGHEYGTNTNQIRYGKEYFIEYHVKNKIHISHMCSPIEESTIHAENASMCNTLTRKFNRQ